MKGTIHSSGTLFLRMEIGTATGSDGTKYELSQSLSGQPMIRSGTTGKWWTVSFEELIEAAIEAGIDQPEEKL